MMGIIDINTLVLTFTAGLLGSYHCIGMCGGIAAVLSAKEGANRNLEIFVYNCGRVFTYVFLGFIAGFLGSRFQGLFESLRPLPNVLPLIFGIIIVLIGLQMLFGFRIGDMRLFRPFNDLLTVVIRQSAALPSRLRPFITGLFNGFMPCPLVYALLLKASSTLNPVSGLAIMLAMGLGTFPVMFLFGRVILYKDSLTSGRLIKAAGMIICILGIVSILKGSGNLIHSDNDMGRRDSCHEE